MVIFIMADEVMKEERNLKIESKFKIGDIFHRKYSRDTVPLKIIEIIYRNGLIEPEYVLKPIRYNVDDKIMLGEEALDELYWLVKNVKSN